MTRIEYLAHALGKALHETWTPAEVDRLAALVDRIVTDYDTHRHPARPSQAEWEAFWSEA